MFFILFLMIKKWCLFIIFGNHKQSSKTGAPVIPACGDVRCDEFEPPPPPPRPVDFSRALVQLEAAVFSLCSGSSLIKPPLTQYHHGLCHFGAWGGPALVLSLVLGFCVLVTHGVCIVKRGEHAHHHPLISGLFFVNMLGAQ